MIIFEYKNVLLVYSKTSVIINFVSSYNLKKLKKNIEIIHGLINGHNTEDIFLIISL